MAIPPFHLAFPVHDIQAAKSFYVGVLGCQEGRSASTWVDFNLHGHQIVAHLVPGYTAASSLHNVMGAPVPHFGTVLGLAEFHNLAARLKAMGVVLLTEPHIRYEGEPAEQWKMFIHDPSGNVIEFKAMTNPDNLFPKNYLSRDRLTDGGS